MIYGAQNIFYHKKSVSSVFNKTTGFFKVINLGLDLQKSGLDKLVKNHAFQILKHIDTLKT